jgi:hypothetical protein
LRSKLGEKQLADEQRKLSSNDEVSQLQRYQQRLETQNETRQQVENAGQAAREFRYDLQQQQQMDQLALSDERDGRARFGDGGGFGGGGLGGGVSVTDAEGPVAEGYSTIPAAAGETGLTSLDVRLPERGVEYLFTTPRGDIEITARNVPTEQVHRVLGLLAILAAVIALVIAYRIGRAIFASTSQRVRAIVSILLGVVSFVGGVLPIVGIILIVWGIVMLIRGATRAASVSTS